jgi:hypothetical protein
MGKGAGEHESRPSPAISEFSIQAIDATLPRTEAALLEKLLQKSDPLLELSFFKKVDIRRNESHFCKDLRIQGFKDSRVQGFKGSSVCFPTIL